MSRNNTSEDIRTHLKKKLFKTSSHQTVFLVFLLDFITIIFWKHVWWEHGESKLQLQEQYAIHSLLKKKLTTPWEAVAHRCPVKICSENFRKIHRKALLPGSLFNKFVGLNLQLY